MTRGRLGALTLALVMLLSGCWSAKEINQIAIVLSVGVDRTDDGQYVVTALMANPSNPSAQAGGGGGGAGSSSEGGGGAWIVGATGPTFFEAVRELAQAVPRRLFWHHFETLVLSEDLARQGIGDLLDVFTRDTEVRRTLHMLVAQGNLFDIVGATPILELSLSRQLDGLIQNRTRHSHTAGSDLAHYMRAHTTNRTAPMGLVLIDKPDPAGGLGLSPPERIELESTAVFWQNRLVGYLDDRESMGALMLQGLLRGGVVSIPCPGEPDRQITVVIERGRSKLSASVQGGRMQGDVALDLEGRVGEVHCTSLAMNPTTGDQIGRLFADKAREIAGAALRKAQTELGVDPFGFGDALYRSNPSAWQRISRDWPRAFTEMDVRMTAKANVRHTGLTHSPNPIRR
jgi:spore germination protein KC